MPDDQAIAPATQRDLATMPIEQALDAYAPSFAAVLPSNITVDHFKRMVVTALNLNPELANADRRTLFNSCVKCASDGLLPDGREAALVIYRTKMKDRQGRDQWIEAVQYMPMIAGIRKRLRNSGEVDSATAEVVHRKDRFKYALGDAAFIQHSPPPLDEDRGDPIGAYAIIRLASGEVIREVMGLKEIEKARAVSRAKDSTAGPWVKWWSEMARKTVMRRAAKAAPQAAMLEKLLMRDEEAELPAPEDLPAIPARPTRAPITVPTGKVMALATVADPYPEDAATYTVDDDGVVTENVEPEPAEEAQPEPEVVEPPAPPAAPPPPRKRAAPGPDLLGDAASEPPRAAEIEPVMDRGRVDWRAWVIALFLPKLRQVETMDQMAELIGDNALHMEAAKAALGAEWPDAAITAAWTRVGR